MGRWGAVVAIAAGCARPAPEVAAAPSAEPEAVRALREAAADPSPMWARLTHLCDRIGHRLAGSAALDEAIAWAAAELERDGFDRVTLEPVEVQAWSRGHEHVAVVAPRPRVLHALGLGNGVGTEGPVTGEVIVADGLDHLDALGPALAGKVVLIDQPFTTYGATASIRTRGPARAARHGAVAAMIRSVAPVSLSTPHTGVTLFGADVTPIPAVALTLEDAAWMRRVSEAGETVRVSLELGARMIGPTTSHNVVAERRGTDLADEIVLLGCHIDSWDVGQGAQDDGAGCLTVWEAGRLLAALPRPRRTLRVVLFTNEENGIAGGRAYAAAHADERHVVVIESDLGAGRIDGFDVATALPESFAPDEARTAAVIEALAPASTLLAPLGAGHFAPGYAGTDIDALIDAGAVGLGLRHDTTGYWPVHHTEADTLDKIDPDAMRHNVEALSALTWWLLSGEPRLIE